MDFCRSDGLLIINELWHFNGSTNAPHLRVVALDIMLQNLFRFEKTNPSAGKNIEAPLTNDGKPETKKKWTSDRHTITVKLITSHYFPQCFSFHFFPMWNEKWRSEYSLEPLLYVLYIVAGSEDVKVIVFNQFILIRSFSLLFPLDMINFMF